MSSRPSLRPLASPALVTLAVGACWLALPFTAGATLDAALDGRSSLARWVIGLMTWALWALGAGVLAVPRTSGLTIARFLVPAALLVAVTAAVVASGSEAEYLGIATVIGISAAAIAAVLTLSAPFGDRCVNGSSYGAERRFALRPTAAMVVAAPLLWVLVATATASGPLLVAADLVVVGGIVTVAGWLVAVVMVRRVHVLSRRWLVLVPAGVVVHDPLVLTDSLLVQRRGLAGLGPAPVDTQARDLTGGAFGLALEVRLSEPASILTNVARREAGGSLTAPGEQVTAVLVAASRPGAVVREAATRRLPGLRPSAPSAGPAPSAGSDGPAGPS